MLLQTGFQLHLGHDGGPCPDYGHKRPNTPEGPVPIDDEAWEDFDVDEIPPHLRPPSGSDYLTVVDVTGVHFLSIGYCTCSESEPEYLQLLRRKLYPATLQMPRTAFTIALLDDFIRDNLECGTSGMNYYSKLRRTTSNVFPHIVPVCRRSSFHNVDL
jgi:hypothetical protein